jgi:hypothetical protein
VGLSGRGPGRVNESLDFELPWFQVAFPGWEWIGQPLVPVLLDQAQVTVGQTVYFTCRLPRFEVSGAGLCGKSRASYFATSFASCRNSSAVLSPSRVFAKCPSASKNSRDG